MCGCASTVPLSNFDGPNFSSFGGYSNTTGTTATTKAETVSKTASDVKETVGSVKSIVNTLFGKEAVSTSSEENQDKPAIPTYVWVVGGLIVLVSLVFTVKKISK